MLKNKTALVTGGSRGIGRAICEKLAEEGCNVAIIYQGRQESAEEVCKKLKDISNDCQTKIYKCDVSDFKSCENLINEVIKDFGKIDILINNAGITRDKLVLSMKEEDFDEVIKVNLYGVFNMIKHVYPHFLRQKSGKIINISSVIGINGNAGQANYAASKAGIIGLTKSVAKELAGRGICVNAIAPGFIKTDMTSALGDGGGGYLEKIPLKRAGLPQEVADLTAFLASDASNYITGEIIRIDGGLGM